ncbi:MAG TPA: hypothetical protein VIL09_02775 [Microvirga sp.]|jgi:hypothetical protein
MPPHYSFEGYAIVSRDDRIADASGRFPDGLRNEADWLYFQEGLDRTALTLLGRASHEASPNAKNRRRLVMSRKVAGVVRQPDGSWWWNPADAPLADALALAAPEGGTIAVPGGRDMFDHIGPGGFTTFHLARAHGCILPGGRGLFAPCEQGVPAERLLSEDGGLTPDGPAWLDETAQVSLTVWKRSP